MKNFKLKILIWTLTLVGATPAFAEKRTFVVETNIVPCVKSMSGNSCNPIAPLTEEIQLEMVNGLPWRKDIIGNQLSQPHPFHLYLQIGSNPNGNGYFVQLVTYDAVTGLSLGSLLQSVGEIEDMGTIYFGSSSVFVSASDNYMLSVKIHLKK
jgi:hypothetical protein